MRKNAGLTIQDRVIVYWKSESEEIKNVINKYENNDKPDIALGRFPIANEEELNYLVNKTILFEDHSFNIDYDFHDLFLVENNEHSAFEDISENIITDILPKSHTTKRVHNNKNSQFYGSTS
ncbi:hypothetical protein KKB14_03195, partial [Patescibacteria group bacterium]|nr:hypothetical protein [Patescibacteria group bacterium]